MNVNYYDDEKMIAKYALLIGLFHRVYPANAIEFTSTNYRPFDYTTTTFNVLQGPAQGNLGHLFDILSGAHGSQQQRTQRRLQPAVAKPQPSSRLQPSDPQLVKLRLSNQLPNNWQPTVRMQPFLVKFTRTGAGDEDDDDDRSNGGFAQIRPVGNYVFGAPSRQARPVMRERLRQQDVLAAPGRQHAAERYGQQETVDRLRQQAVDRYRRETAEKLKQQAVDSLKQQQAQIFSLMERVKQVKRENQRRNLEVWQRHIKQRNKHIQRRFYEHALHDDDDNDDDDDQATVMPSITVTSRMIHLS